MLPAENGSRKYTTWVSTNSERTIELTQTPTSIQSQQMLSNT